MLSWRCDQLFATELCFEAVHNVHSIKNTIKKKEILIKRVQKWRGKATLRRGVLYHEENFLKGSVLLYETFSSIPN